ncbi:MAG: MerR family transcriptional regulator [Anaerolineae bacterium]
MKLYRIGEFASKAGVTVRTIRYYDRIGLLQPSARSESNQRLYTEMDFARLLQILTLKLIGLSLDNISRILAGDAASIYDLLDRQKAALKNKAQQLLSMVQAIEKAQSVLDHSSDLDLDQFVNIIKAITVNDQAQWFSQFISHEQKKILVESSYVKELDGQHQDGWDWKLLFRDVIMNMDRDVHDPDLQSLVVRWDLLMKQYLSLDNNAEADAFAAALNRAFAQIDQSPDIRDTTVAIREWAETLRDVAGFIQRIREAGRSNSKPDPLQ